MILISLWVEQFEGQPVSSFMQIEHFFTCPYCWQEVSILLEPYAEEQQFTEDCEVCCRPIAFCVGYDGEALWLFSAETDEEI